MKNYRITYTHAVYDDRRIYDVKAQTLEASIRAFPFYKLMTAEIHSVRELKTGEPDAAWITDRARLEPVYGPDWEHYRF